MKPTIRIIPQLNRNAMRWTEIAAVLSKYGFASWLSRFIIDFISDQHASYRLFCELRQHFLPLSPRIWKIHGVGIDSGVTVDMINGHQSLGELRPPQFGRSS